MTAVLSRVSERTKLTAVSVMLTLPLLVVSSAYVSVEHGRLVSGRLERAGAAYLVPLSRLATEVTLARHTLALGGRPDATAMRTAVDAVDRVDDRYGHALGLDGQWPKVDDTLERAVAVDGVRAGVAAYNSAVDQILALITRVREPSTALDADVDTYYVMNAVILQLPVLLDTPLRAIDLALSTSPGGEVGGGAGLAAMAAMAGRTTVVTNSLNTGLAKAFAATSSPALLALKPLTMRTVAIHRAGSAHVLATAAAGATLAVEPGLLDPMITQTTALSRALLPVVEDLIDARIRHLEHRIYGVGAATGLAILLAAYVLLSSLRGIRRGRDQAVAAAEAKSAFLATMSHEIRTPLNAVIGMTGVLMDTDLDENQREYVTTVRDSGEALLSTINDILDFSKIESGQLDLEAEPFDVRDCVESALALVALPAERKGLELVGSVDAGCPPMLRGDVTRLRQIVVNLLSNAVKFTEHGEVVVSTHARQLTPDPAGPVQLSVAVRDTGPGIPADRVDRVFRSFSQVDSSTTRVHGGTGLGLAISRNLARAMGGDIALGSTVGAGSTFTLTAQLSGCPDVTPAGVGPSRLIGATALIVDDNATNRRVLSLQLTGWGMTCLEAGSAANALALLAAGSRVDVAILDMQMPGKDGVALARDLRAHPETAGLPLILLSSVQWRPGPDAHGLFAAVLAKPARAALLHDRITRALDPQPTGPRRSDDSLPTRAQPNGQAGTADVPQPQALRILLVEDNPVNQRVAQLLLGQLGYRADTAGNGLEALRALQRAAYDVVLMDVQMPVMDGLEATRRVRADLPAAQQPHIIAMTASVLVEDRTACRAAGMNDYLAKPVRVHALRDALAVLTPATPTSTAPGLAPPESAPPESARSEATVSGPTAQLAVSPDGVLDHHPDAERLDSEHGSPADHGPLEESVRGRLRELVGPGSPLDERRLVAGLARSFTAAGPQLLVQLTAAVHLGDNGTAEARAHRLRGAAANLGLSMLADLCTRYEDLARAYALTAGSDHAAGLAAAAAELDRGLAVLDRLLAELGPLDDGARHGSARHEAASYESAASAAPSTPGPNQMSDSDVGQWS
ncbi:hybrid sensor histidine kinase/response regulator [Cryptosporangium phraense]|uniref:Circadian input-output histidine kinase CikA n=1 Tax=Cryptosporangium phraense TaxID=2593070 RepID=A0A545AUY8_9ACTN|nr:response regulator [Cryptosporangium phraense]TQS45149.1 response regulator [Cryptosporangium phraense]